MVKMLVDLEESPEEVYLKITNIIMDGYYKHDIMLAKKQNQNENENKHYL